MTKTCFSREPTKDDQDFIAINVTDISNSFLKIDLVFIKNQIKQ